MTPTTGDLRVACIVGSRLWIKSFDLEAHNGRGEFRTTSDPGEALLMPYADWMAAYLSSPACRPLREDGKPNRPLTGLKALMFEPPPPGRTFARPGGAA